MSEEGKSSKIIKAGIGYTIGNYLIKGISFFTIPLFARILTVEEYGLFNIFIAYESILYVCIAFSMHSCVKHAKYKFKNEFPKFVSSIVLLAIINFIVCLVAINLFYFKWTDILGLDRFIGNLLIVNSFGSAIILIYNHYISLTYEYKGYIVVAGLNSFLNILLSFLFILVLWKDNGYEARVLGSALSAFIVSIYIVYIFFKQKKPSINLSYWKYAINYSLPIIPHGISQVILNQFDRIMIQRMVNNTAAGFYSFSYNIYSLVFVTTVSLDNVWSPWLFEKLKSKQYDTVQKYQTSYNICMAIFVCLVMLISPELIRILGGETYKESFITVIPLIIGGYFVYLYTLPVNVEYYCAKTKFIGLGTCLAAIINIILNYFFILQFGYIAAAYTTLVTYVLYFIFHLLLAKRALGMNVFSIKSFLISIIIVAVGGVLSFVLQKMFFVRILIVIFVCVALVYYLQKEFSAFNRLLNKIKGMS